MDKEVFIFNTMVNVLQKRTAKDLSSKNLAKTLKGIIKDAGIAYDSMWKICQVHYLKIVEEQKKAEGINNA